MHTTKSVSRPLAYILTAESLKRLVKILERVSPDLTYEVTCSDDSELHPSSLEELLEIPNSVSRWITSVAVQTPVRREAFAKVRLFNQSDFESFSYELWGEDASVLVLSRDLDEFSTSIRQWYSPFAFTNKWAVMLVLVVLGLISGIFFVQLKPSAKNQIPVVNHIPDSVFPVLFWVLLAAGYLGTTFRKLIFPRGVFAIGDGLNRYRASQGRRKSFGIGAFIFAVVASLIATGIATWLSHTR